jgi:hypothetical protein
VVENEAQRERQGDLYVGLRLYVDWSRANPAYGAIDRVLTSVTERVTG